MIDGVKIDVPNLNGKEWLSNDLLNFHAYTSTSTGELLEGTQVAKYKGLKFFITQSKKYNNIQYCSIRGSLHKYFNNGNHNANDFTFENLQSVLNDLSKNFQIDPKKAVLRNVEFGVNILTPITAKALLKNLVAYGKYTFGTLKIEGINVGKSIDKQQTKIKVYDKGKQNKKPLENLVRIEMLVRKMTFLKSYGIHTLSDLQDCNKVNPLGRLLVEFWNEVIYYDKKVTWKHLSEFERKKILYYATPRNWEDFSRVQRMRAKKHFKSIMQQCGVNQTQNEIGHLIAQKWKDLTASFCIRFNHDSKEILQHQNVYDLTVRIHGYFVDKSTLKNPSLKTKEKTHKKRRKCNVCQSSISHKRSQAKYCSKKCNNKCNGMKRTQKRQKRILVEKELLDRLLKKLAKKRLILTITYTDGTNTYTDQFHQNEIGTTKDWIQKIGRVIVTEYRKKAQPIVLTSYRARKLITLINHYNEKELQNTVSKSR